MKFGGHRKIKKRWNAEPSVTKIKSCAPGRREDTYNRGLSRRSLRVMSYGLNTAE